MLTLLSFGYSVKTIPEAALLLKKKKKQNERSVWHDSGKVSDSLKWWEFLMKYPGWSRKHSTLCRYESELAFWISALVNVTHEIGCLGDNLAPQESLRSEEVSQYLPTPKTWWSDNFLQNTICLNFTFQHKGMTGQVWNLVGLVQANPTCTFCTLHTQLPLRAQD